MNIDVIALKLKDDTKLPKYILFADALKKYIKDNNLQCGVRLPSERSIAENCNISPVTVNRGLNELVKKGILNRKMGSGTYVSDNKIFGSHFRIGIVAHEPILFDDCYITEALKSLHNYWKERQVDVGLFIKTPDQYEQIIRAYDLVGLIVLSPQEEFVEDFIKLANKKIPFVTIGQLFAKLPYHSFGTAHENTGEDAVKYLNSLGHEKIAIINSHPQYSSSNERERGYLQGMWNAKLPTFPGWVIHGSFEHETIDKKSFIDLLNSKNRPTALLINYGETLKVYDFFNELNFKIPDDISILAFDDPIYADKLTPSLTTFKQPIKDFSVKASMQLERLINNQPLEEFKSKGLILIERNSCKQIK